MTNKREAIIDAGIRRIADQGCSFTTGQIASDLECSQALIFRYYRTKEGLMTACFEKVCHELMLVMKGVELPSKLTRESIDGYMIELWNTYRSYLESNVHIAKAYMYFVCTGRRYPQRYRTAERVLKGILGDDYYRIASVYPDFRYAVEYIVMLSNALATGKFIDWKNDPVAGDKLDTILRYGILGMGQTA